MEKYIGDLELDNGDVVAVVLKNGYLVAGGATNSGMFEDYKMKYDNDLSLDVNLQNFIEYIENHMKRDSKPRKHTHRTIEKDNWKKNFKHKRGKSYCAKTTKDAFKNTLKDYRTGATKLVYVLQGDYGYGWDDLTSSDTYSEAKQDYKDYQANEKVPLRIIQRRIPKDSKGMY